MYLNGDWTFSRRFVAACSKNDVGPQNKIASKLLVYLKQLNAQPGKILEDHLKSITLPSKYIAISDGPLSSCEYKNDWLAGSVGGRKSAVEGRMTSRACNNLVNCAAALLVCGVALNNVGFAYAQAWPSKPVRIIVPYPAGGGIDILGRELAQGLQKLTGQTFLVENRPGAATAVGTAQVAKSAPDGHTILLTSDSTVSINPYVFSNLPYDNKELMPLSNILMIYFVLTVHPSTGVNSLKDLIELARNNPNKFSYASFGMGSQPQLVMEALKELAKIQLLHVPYKGGPELTQAALAGTVDLALSNIPTAAANIASGKLVPLAFGGSGRSPALPSVPTFAELGYEVGAYAWWGMFLPAATPKDLAMRIYDQVKSVISTPEFHARQAKRGFEVIGSTPDEFAAYLKLEGASRRKLVDSAGIKAD